MKAVNKIYLALTVLALIGVASCKKGDTGSASPSGSTGADSGVIQGYVAVYNQYGIRVYEGLRDMQVSMTNGATVGTDDNGHYIFTGLKAGSYTLSASGVGLAPTVMTNVPFVKDTLYNNIKISERPTFNVNSITAMLDPSSQYDSVMVTCDGDSRARNAIIFAGADEHVSNTNYKLAYVVPVTHVMPFTGAYYGVAHVSAADLHAAGISAGQTVYYAAYSYVVNDASAYVDPTTGKTVYNAVGQAITASTTAP
jgi:hypothetical protein